MADIDKEKETELFNKVLATNTHLTPIHYPLLRIWCRFQIAMEDMEAGNELVKLSQESRLLGSNLKLMPTRRQDKKLDLAVLLSSEKGGEEKKKNDG